MDKLKLIYLSEYITRCFSKINKCIVDENIVYFYIDKEQLKNLLNFLSKSSVIQCNQLLDIWGVDFPEKENRFEVNYLVCSTVFNYRVIIKVETNESDGLESVTGLFKSAGWLEREIWDMYGVIFFGNNDLRRILTDYGFEGHPLRKDFPLSGYLEVRYDDGEKRVLQEPLEVSQEYRSFNFKSPWEN